jgi:hypothetical protein
MYKCVKTQIKNFKFRKLLSEESKSIVNKDTLLFQLCWLSCDISF